MTHPIPKGTPVVAAYHSCPTCGPSRIEKVNTRIREYEEKNGMYIYTLLDGRKVNQTEILEIR